MAATLICGGCLGVAIVTPDPSWPLIVSLIAAVVVSAWLLLGFTDGYRPATAEELAAIQASHLWHVTGAVDDVVDDQGNAHLDPSKCRWFARMSDYRRPWKRTHASYAFRNRPRRTQLAIHVRRTQRVAVLRLDGAHVEQAYVGPAGAVALPAGYDGPAEVYPITK